MHGLCLFVVDKVAEYAVSVGNTSTNYTFVVDIHVVCLPAHALPLCTSSQVAHRGSLHWMQADTFIVSYPLLQKLESLSLIDEAWLVSGTLPANTHKNRSKDVLPCECACHLRTPPPPLPLGSSALVIRMQYTSSIGVVNCFSHTLSPSSPPTSFTPLPPPLLPQMIPIACA